MYKIKLSVVMIIVMFLPQIFDTDKYKININMFTKLFKGIN